MLQQGPEPWPIKPSVGLKLSICLQLHGGIGELEDSLTEQFRYALTILKNFACHLWVVAVSLSFATTDLARSNMM
jgi:hypothetical protein